MRKIIYKIEAGQYGDKIKDDFYTFALFYVWRSFMIVRSTICWFCVFIYMKEGSVVVEDLVMLYFSTVVK